MRWVVYSHTDYLDVLEVFSAYAEGIRDKVLLINAGAVLPQTIQKGYDQVIYYDDTLPYASRLLALKALTDEYVLFIHDMDIILYRDDLYLELLQVAMKSLGLDRIDLKPGNNPEGLERIVDPLNYPYNVNPSIWKLSTFMEVMEKFPGESYRTIELLPTQYHCLQYQIYRPYTDKPIPCGYYRCLPWFQFLHISHHGQFMPAGNQYMSAEVSAEYDKICDKYLSRSGRGYKVTMW